MPAYSFEDLYTRVSRYLGIGSSPSGTDLSLVKQIVNDAYREVMNYTEWSFLKVSGTVTTVSGQWRYLLGGSNAPGFDSLAASTISFAGSQYPDLQERSENIILSSRAASSNVTGYPQYFAVRTASHSPQAGTQYELILHPVPSGVYTLNIRYNLDPDELSSADDYPVGGGALASLILEQSLALAEERENDTINGIHSNKAKSLFLMAKQKDLNRTASSLGNGVTMEVSMSRSINYNNT